MAAAGSQPMISAPARLRAEISPSGPTVSTPSRMLSSALL